jgi:hypothetical protein
MAEETETAEAKPKKRKLLKVTVLARQGQSVLVEWTDGGTRRGYVPADELEDGKVAKDVLEAALPYGVPWGAFVDFSRLTPEEFEAKLRAMGIWTIADLERQPRMVARVLGDLAVTASELHTKVRQHTED